MCNTCDMASQVLTRRSLRETGRDLREMRLNRGLTPEDLGALVHVSGRTIRRIEDGHRPTVRVMFAIASEFDMEVVELWPA